MTVSIVCPGPGPHIPSDGVLGSASTPVTGMFCSSPSCIPQPDQASVNVSTLAARAQAALTANATYLALASPTNTQVMAQVQRLTKECNALIRLSLTLTADVSDTA